MKPNPRPQLTSSKMGTFDACQQQFQYLYGLEFGIYHEKLIRPPGIALVTGIAVHAGIAENLQNKVETGEPIERDAALAVTVDQFESEWEGGVDLTDEEFDNKEKVKGEAKDMTVSLSALHYDRVAPDIEPLAIEEAFVLNLTNYPFDFSGRKDVRTETHIRDSKTAKGMGNLPGPGEVTLQAIGYSKAERLAKRAVKPFIFDVLLKYAKGPAYKRLEAIATEADFARFDRRIEATTIAIEAIREGHAKPLGAEYGSWRCTKKWCGFTDVCPYWSGRNG